MSRIVNDRMPAYCVGKLAELHGDLPGARVVVLGLAYRGGVKETAFSGCWSLVEELQARGATPFVEDPLYTDDELIAFGLEPWHFGEPIDAAIVQSDHVEYRSIGPDDLPGIRTLVDGRNVIENPDKFTAGNVAWSILGRRTEPRADS